MFKPRPCGCKGIRTCLVCEAEFGVEKPSVEALNQDVFEYCYLCNKAWMGTDVVKAHGRHTGPSLEYPAKTGGSSKTHPNFISEEEERELVSGCDNLPWDLSQSGRRKQNFGPKTNFKKKKINGKSFNGFPKFSQFAQEKLRSVDELKDFQTIEQCAIEYRVETGACIDPHIDDCWVWGERVISINLISDSVLTMTKYTGSRNRYNLNYYYKLPLENLEDNLNPGKLPSDFPIVRIPMPARSLLVIYGAARYEWEHCIYRKDITDRRICMAYREFTPEYLEGGENYHNSGLDILKKALNFWEVDSTVICN